MSFCLFLSLILLFQLWWARWVVGVGGKYWPFPMVTVPSSGAQIFLSSTYSLFFTLSTPHRQSETVTFPYPLLQSSSTVSVSDSPSHIVFTCTLSFVTLSSSHCHPHTDVLKRSLPHIPLSYSSFTVSVSDCLWGVESLKKREYVDDRKICTPLEGTVTIGNGQYLLRVLWPSMSLPPPPTTVELKKQKNWRQTKTKRHTNLLYNPSNSLQAHYKLV